ncbi:hypothetical protein F4777DRAFT_238672 [Nemania sp. FL0916]|nr:hypothetical protein F4777DRAFT_238672 [Nemania sp. FL0916]
MARSSSLFRLLSPVSSLLWKKSPFQTYPDPANGFNLLSSIARLLQLISFNLRASHTSLICSATPSASPRAP